MRDIIWEDAIRVKIVLLLREFFYHCPERLQTNPYWHHLCVFRIALGIGPPQKSVRRTKLLSLVRLFTIPELDLKLMNSHSL